MSLEKEFVPCEESLELKELGFDEPCFGYYVIDGEELIVEKWMQHPNKSTWTINAPTFSQAFKWFREKYDMAHQITYAGAKGRYNAFTDDWVYDSSGELKEFSYEEAELACLKKLIEIVKEKQP